MLYILMGSNYFGEQNMGSERGGSSNSSTRRAKKSSNNSDKPKQPQRGLGVAQLEKIRLHGQVAACPNYHLVDLHASYENMRLQAAFSSMPSPSQPFSYSSSNYPAPYGFHHNTMPAGIIHDHYERTNIRYSDSQPASWIPNFGVYEAQYLVPDINRHLMDLHNVESAFHQNVKKARCGSMGSSTSRNSDSSDTQEVDLELRLSI